MARYWFDTALPAPDKPIEAPGNPAGYILSAELGLRVCAYLHEQNIRCHRASEARWKRLQAIRRLG